MEKVRSWLTGATYAALAARVAVAVLAAVMAGGEPLVGLCAALAAELGALDGVLPPKL